MNKFTVIMIALFSINYQTDLHQTTTTDEPYELSFQVEKLKNNTYNLTVVMELDEGAHYVSPNSKGDYTGKFVMILEKTTNLQMQGKFSESPLSKETINSWNGDPVNFVTKNTTHTQQFTVSAKNDFDVSGYIQFTIEPRCTLEKVTFTISNRAGKIEIKKVTS